MSSLLVILFGVVKQFCRFWIWSETECKTPGQNMVYKTTQHPHSHTLSVYIVHLVWEGEKVGEVIEEVDGQQYTSMVPSPMGATVHKLGRKYLPWVNVSPVYKIC